MVTLTCELLWQKQLWFGCFFLKKKKEKESYASSMRKT